MVAIKAASSDAAAKKNGLDTKTESSVMIIIENTESVDSGINVQEFTKVKKESNLDKSLLTAFNNFSKGEELSRDALTCKYHKSSCIMFNPDITLQDQCLVLSKLSYFRKVLALIGFLSIIAAGYAAVFRLGAYKINPFYEIAAINSNESPSYTETTIDSLVVIVVMTTSTLAIINLFLNSVLKTMVVMNDTRVIVICSMMMVMMVNVVTLVIAGMIFQSSSKPDNELDDTAFNWSVVIFGGLMMLLFLQYCMSRFLSRMEFYIRSKYSMPEVHSKQSNWRVLYQLMLFLVGVLTLNALQLSELQRGAPLEACVVSDSTNCPKLRVPFIAYYGTSVTVLVSTIFALGNLCLTTVSQHTVLQFLRVPSILLCLVSTIVAYVTCKVQGLAICTRTWGLLIGYLVVVIYAQVVEFFAFFKTMRKDEREDVTDLTPDNELVPRRRKKGKYIQCSCPNIHWTSQLYMKAFPVKCKKEPLTEVFDSFYFLVAFCAFMTLLTNWSEKYANETTGEKLYMFTNLFMAYMAAICYIMNMAMRVFSVRLQTLTLFSRKKNVFEIVYLLVLMILLCFDYSHMKFEMQHEVPFIMCCLKIVYNLLLFTITRPVPSIEGVPDRF